MYTELYKKIIDIFFTPIEKIQFTKKGSVRKGGREKLTRLRLYFFPLLSICFSPRAAVGVAENPHQRVVEPVGPREIQTPSTRRVRVPIQTMFAVGSATSPARCSLRRLPSCATGPFTRSRISCGTYVHNLQRTTPTAFCRFSRVMCARAPLCPFSLSVSPPSTCHRAHPYPTDERGERVL